MTKEELVSLVEKETMVYSITENIGYTFMGVKDGKYQLCGMPFPYSKIIMLECFYIK